jgi:hypothetical protein
MGDSAAAFTQKTEAARLGLEKLVDRHHRDQIAARIVEAYRRVPSVELRRSSRPNLARAHRGQ